MKSKKLTFLLLNPLVKMQFTLKLLNYILKLLRQLRLFSLSFQIGKMLSIYNSTKVESFELVGTLRHLRKIKAAIFITNFAILVSF